MLNSYYPYKELKCKLHYNIFFYTGIEMFTHIHSKSLIVGQRPQYIIETYHKVSVWCDSHPVVM